MSFDAVLDILKFSISLVGLLLAAAPSDPPGKARRRILWACALAVVLIGATELSRRREQQAVLTRSTHQILRTLATGNQTYDELREAAGPIEGTTLDRALDSAIGRELIDFTTVSLRQDDGSPRRVRMYFGTAAVN